MLNEMVGEDTTSRGCDGRNNLEGSEDFGCRQKRMNIDALRSGNEYIMT